VGCAGDEELALSRGNYSWDLSELERVIKQQKKKDAEQGKGRFPGIKACG
jgi:hypothetical protein